MLILKRSTLPRVEKMFSNSVDNSVNVCKHCNTLTHFNPLNLKNTHVLMINYYYNMFITKFIPSLMIMMLILKMNVILSQSQYVKMTRYGVLRQVLGVNRRPASNWYYGSRYVYIKHFKMTDTIKYMSSPDVSNYHDSRDIHQSNLCLNCQILVNTVLELSESRGGCFRLYPMRYMTIRTYKIICSFDICILRLVLNQ